MTTADLIVSVFGIRGIVAQAYPRGGSAVGQA